MMNAISRGNSEKLIGLGIITRNSIRILLGVAILGLMVVGTSWSATASAQEVSTHASSYIVLYEDGISEGSGAAAIVRHGGAVETRLPIINGAVIVIPSVRVQELLADPSIKHIEVDATVYAFGNSAIDILAKGRPSSGQPAEVLPWGVDRIDAELAWSISRGSNVKVGVVDTGISLSHPDLSGNIAGGYNAIDPTKSANDDNGHGTHVAGTIGAVDNSIGVIGVAPEVDLYAIKVLNRNGSGTLSDVIEGLDWSRSNGMDVVNMSLGTATDSLSMHVAVAQAQNSGVIVVAAAGNSGGAVGYPAAYMESIAVSATDQNNNVASFSSRGSEVDVAAPGVSIYSTYKGTGYSTLNGTSMATPHVTGSIALLLLTTPGGYDVNFNGSWDPEEAQRKLEDTAVDLGASGKDNLYGSGLVDALSLVSS